MSLSLLWWDKGPRTVNNVHRLLHRAKSNLKVNCLSTKTQLQTAEMKLQLFPYCFLTFYLVLFKVSWLKSDFALESNGSSTSLWDQIKRFSTLVVEALKIINDHHYRRHCAMYGNDLVRSPLHISFFFCRHAHFTDAFTWNIGEQAQNGWWYVCTNGKYRTMS